MSAIAKPYVTSSKTSSPSQPVNIELAGGFDKNEVDTAITPGTAASGKEFQIVFTMQKHDLQPSTIIWKYVDDKTSRDEDFVSLVALVAATLA